MILKITYPNQTEQEISLPDGVNLIKQMEIFRNFLIEEVKVEILSDEKKWAYSKDKDRFYEGYVRDVYSQKVLLKNAQDMKP